MLVSIRRTSARKCRMFKFVKGDLFVVEFSRQKLNLLVFFVELMAHLVAF